MMYVELYQYLIQYKQLPVPGIGTFLSEKRSADFDFVNKKINPPSYNIALKPGGQLPGQSFFVWLADVLGVSGREAIFRFNDFAFDMKKQLSEGAIINWNGVGMLKKGLAGDVKLTPLNRSVVLEKPVAAIAVTRRTYEHKIRVGEDEMTSTEITKKLNELEEIKSTWWIFPLVVTFLASGFIFLNFSREGVDGAATSNKTKLIPAETMTNYQVLP